MNAATISRRSFKAATGNHPNATIICGLCFTAALILMVSWLPFNKPDISSLNVSLTAQSRLVAIESLETRGLHTVVTMSEFRTQTAGRTYTVGMWSGWNAGQQPSVNDHVGWKVWYFADLSGIRLVASEDIPYIGRWGYADVTTFDQSAKAFTTVPERSYWLFIPIILFLAVGSVIASFIWSDA